MGIDNSTPPRTVNISITDKKEYLDILRITGEKNDTEDCLNADDENHRLITDELYYEDGEITFTGRMSNSEGETSIYLVIPISDTVLIDILAGALKKFNKFKTVMETLKTDK